MATRAGIQKKIEQARTIIQSVQNQATLLNSEVDRGALPGDPDFIQNRANALDEQLNTAIDLLNSAADDVFDLPDEDGSASLKTSLLNIIDSLNDVAVDTSSRLNSIVDKSFNNKRQKDLQQESQPKNSAGDIVDNEQDAQKADARVQSPQQGDLTTDDQDRVVAQPENVNTGSNAREPNTQDDIDRNANTSPVGGDAVSNVGGDSPPVPTSRSQRTTTVGASAPDEDQIDSTQSSTATTAGNDGRPTVAKEFLAPIIPRPNLLSGLSSMTYGLSLYLMNPDEFSEFVGKEEKILPTSQLLMQSGGINKDQRNEWFNVDFYIEDFTLESVIGTQSVGMPHNAVSLEFTVLEPQGITFLNRLNNAVIAHLAGQEPQEEQEKINAQAQGYLMVIRFYGFDASGNPVTAAELGLDPTTDSNAVLEKFIPFNITNFTYKISSKVTEYKIQGACSGTNIAFSTQRGEIPFNVQLTAGTLDQLFNGNKVVVESQDEENTEQGNNQTGSTQTIARGLIQALNEQQAKLAGESYDIPDQYEIVFQDADIKNAKLLKPGNVNKGRASNNTSTQAAQKYLQSKLNFDKESQTYNVLAGTQITQLLDLVLRTSSYVTSQQDVYIDEKTGKPVSSEDANGQPKSVKTVQWYRIKSQVKPLGYDKKRKTLAYKITYFVNKYQINTPRSPYFPPAEYRGTHKLYNYWFTGQNTEVLDFEIDVNSNYYTVIGNDGRIDERPQGKIMSQQSYSAAPGQSTQGGERGSTVPAANLSDRLYSIGDVASGEITIVGDPDWIQQSEIVYNKSVGLGPFTRDGSVNFDGSEVLFEIRFNPVQDYDLETGLSNVYENNRDITIQDVNDQIVQKNVAQEVLVWCATTVTSTFSDGKFTQRLNGVYREFNSAKGAPLNSAVHTQLSNRQSIEQTLANREKDSENKNTNKTGLKNGTPKKGVTNRTLVVDAPTTFDVNSADDDAIEVDQTNILGA